MLTRNGHLTVIGDTIDLLRTLNEMLNQGMVTEAHAYIQTAHGALMQLGHQWVHSDAAYDVIAKSLHKLPEVLINERRQDDPNNSAET